MDTPNDPAQSGLPSELQITVPPGDNALTSEHLVLISVARIAQALTEITEVLDVHADMAPVTAIRVTDMATVIATTMIEWLKVWN